jgi:hypothetical protein
MAFVEVAAFRNVSTIRVLVRVSNPLHATHEISCLETLAFGCICLVLDEEKKRISLSPVEADYLHFIVEMCEPSSLIGIVTRLRVGRPKNRGSIPRRLRFFSLSSGYRTLSRGVRRSGAHLTTHLFYEYVVPKDNKDWSYSPLPLTRHSLRGA